MLGLGKVQPRNDDRVPSGSLVKYDGQQRLLRLSDQSSCCMDSPTTLQEVIAA
jgi:hypothetical protein